MADCTVPTLLGLKAWFDANLGDCCDWHDERYVARDCYKVQADFGVALRIAQKKRRYWLVGAAAFLVLQVHPKAYYLWYTE